MLEILVILCVLLCLVALPLILLAAGLKLFVWIVMIPLHLVRFVAGLLVGAVGLALGLAGAVLGLVIAGVFVLGLLFVFGVVPLLVLGTPILLVGLGLWLLVRLLQTRPAVPSAM